MSENPFTPSFGTVPLVMAGRDDLLTGMENALMRTGRDPLLSSLLVGMRGTGKTALLACIREKAQQAGWVAVGSVALPGLLEDVYEQTVLAPEHLVDTETQRSVTSVGIGPVSVGWEERRPERGVWRTRMTRLLNRLADSKTGLLITVDEVKADEDEMVQLAAVYQMFVSEGRRVALIMAGLPYHVHQLVSHDSVSFLRRASQFELSAIDEDDVAIAMRETFESSGKRIDDEALDLCVTAVGGFPYLLQLIGYRTWEACGDDDMVDVEAARHGSAWAMREMEEHVLAATYRELSTGDIRYLTAMLPDAQESRTADVAARMGVTSGYASAYKARLLAQGVIGQPARGWVRFEIPGMRDYLARRIAESPEA